MKGKQIFYWLSLLLCLAVAGCSSDGEDEVTPKDEPGYFFDKSMLNLDIFQYITL